MILYVLIIWLLPLDIYSNRCFSNDNDFKNPSGYRRQGGVFVCVNYKVMQEKATVI